MASSRCWRLARSLNVYSQRVSREDVQMIVTQLLQCAANIQTVRQQLYEQLIDDYPCTSFI
jgi:hypothetical protein